MKKEIPGSKDAFKNTTYPETRKLVTDKRNANWKGTNLGRSALCAIAWHANAVDNASDYAHHRNFVAKQVLFDSLVQTCPWILSWYINQTGNDLTPEIVYGRHHKMFYTNGIKGKGGRPQISTEHPMNNLRLRQIWSRVEKFLSKNFSVPEEDAEKLGSLNSVTQMRKINHVKS